MAIHAWVVIFSLICGNILIGKNVPYYTGAYMKTITVQAVIDNLSQVLDFIDTELENAGCGMKSQMQIDIAVEELFVNVSHYAYAPGTGDITVGIRFSSDPDLAEIILKDSGVPYDPLAKEDPDIALSAEEREVGGLGIYMVKKSMDFMKYEYTDGHNIVTIGKYF